MPTDFSDLSDFISLLEAIPLFPFRPHRNTVIRWANVGCYGIKLKTVRFGGKRLTRSVWIDEFNAAVMGASPDVYAKTPTSSHEAAEAKLDSLGVV